MYIKVYNHVYVHCNIFMINKRDLQQKQQQKTTFFSTFSTFLLILFA